MNKKVLPLIGLTLLVLGLISLLLSAILVPFTLYTFSSHKIALKPTTVCGKGACGPGPDNINNSSYSFFDVQHKRPLYMSLHGSDTVSAAFGVMIHGSLPSPTPFPSNYQIDRYELPGQPKCLYPCTPETQFGSGYTVFAFAQLSSATFNIQTVGDAEQIANVPIVYWDWNILANENGSQVANLLVELRWKRSGVTEHTVKILRQSFPIQVTQPLLTIDPLSIGVLFSGVINTALGAGLTIPFLAQTLGKRKKKKSHPSSVLMPSLSGASLERVQNADITSQIRFCYKCGSSLGVESIYCNNCGTRL